MDLLKMHPFQIIIIAVFGVLGFIGLFLFATYKPDGPGSGAVGTVIVWGTLPDAEFSTALQNFTRTNKNYAGVKYVEKSEETFATDLAEAVASGKGPDLIIISEERLLSQTNKIALQSFKTFSERDYTDTYVPLFDLFLTDTGAYARPLLVDPLVLYYNKGQVASAGVATPPQTWEAITALAGSMTRTLPDQTITRSTIALGEYDNIGNARAILSLLLLQSGSKVTEMTKNGVRASLSGGATGETFGITPAESAVSFYTQFANPGKTVYSWNRSLPQARDSFLAGDSTFYVGFASERPLLKEGNPNLSFDMARIPQPQTADGRIAYAHGYAIAKLASSRAKGNDKVIEALSGKEFSASVAEYLSMAPARKDSLTPPEGDLFAPVFYSESLVARAWLSPSPEETDVIFSTMIRNITSGSKNVRDALFTAEKSLDASLK
ncbi:MAG: extracellular solute-binding protein [Candidatus Pacebacteria bacterium]|nr:extracellular solute-binding protein [Candidatus Paceibacterota bacterium]